MKIAFFGNTNTSLECLKYLYDNNIDICLVVADPPKKIGRGYKEIITPTITFARENGIGYLETTTLKGDDIYTTISDYKPDLLVVVDYGRLIPDSIITIASEGGINLHFSLLPRYRGASPVQSALQSGDKKTGVSVQYLASKLDSGDIIIKREIDILDEDDAISLFKKLTDIGKVALLDAIRLIERGEQKPVAQNEAEASYCKKIKKEDGFIDWGDSSKNIFNKIRAFVIWPVAMTYFHLRLVKIYKAAIVDDSVSIAGEYSAGSIIVDKKRLFVRTGDGYLEILELQMEGKKRVKAADFINGYKVKTGDKFESRR